MPSVPMIARKKFPYCLQSYVPGDAFEARDESDAHVLETTRLASRAIVPTKELTGEEAAAFKATWDAALSDSTVRSHEPIQVLEEGDDGDDGAEAESETPVPDSPSTDPNHKRRYVRSGKYKRRDLTAEE